MIIHWLSKCRCQSVQVSSSTGEIYCGRGIALEKVCVLELQVLEYLHAVSKQSDPYINDSLSDISLIYLSAVTDKFVCD